MGQVKSLFFEETRKEWLHQTRVRLRVVEAFTGVTGGEFEVRTGWGDGDCGIVFCAGTDISDQSLSNGGGDLVDLYVFGHRGSLQGD